MTAQFAAGSPARARGSVPAVDVRDHVDMGRAVNPAMPLAGEASTQSTLAVATHGLTKRFRSGQVAVDRVDLAVPEGAVYGFLGPNGSGKTTTIRLLLGLISPTAGRAELLGLAVPEAAGRALPQVGAVVEGPAFHPYLSGRANLGRLDAGDLTVDPATSGRRVDEALDRVGLLPAARKRYRFYSLGMRQRLAIASTLLRPRRLLILDEPTNGLDPQGTREVRTLVTELAAAGSTVLISSHLLSEVEQICTHLGVMHLGRLVAQGPMPELRAGVAPRVRVDTSRPDDAAAVLRRQGLSDLTVTPSAVEGPLGPGEPERLVSELVHAGVPVRGFAVRAANLEDLFVSLTGEGFDVGS